MRAQPAAVVDGTDIDRASERASDAPAVAAAPGTTQLPDLCRTRLASWPLAAGYGAVILAQPLLIGSLLEDYFMPGPVVASRLLAVRATDLPASSGSFRQQAFETLTPDRERRRPILSALVLSVGRANGQRLVGWPVSRLA